MIGSTPAAPRPALIGTDALYVTDDDFLLVTSLNATASLRLTIGGRLLRRDGAVVPLQEPHTANTDRTPATSVHKLAEGWLQSLSAIASTASVYGQTYLRVDLCRGSGAGARTVIGTLLQGLATSTQPLAWPGAPLATTQERPGAPRSITGTDPGAAAEISETVPTGARWQPLALSFTLLTDATVANREVAITFDDGAAIYFVQLPGAVQSAGGTRRYSYGIGTAVVQGGLGAADRTIPMPRLVMLAGHRIRSVTGNIQAGDNYSAPQLLVEEWLEGA